MSAPPSYPRILVPPLLAVAAVALVVPWDAPVARVATGLAAVSVLAAFGLTCGMAGRRAGSSGSESTEALDWSSLLDRLDRIATALEARPLAAGPAPDGLAKLARAIAEARWADAEAMLAEQPDHPDAARYAEQLASARGAAGEALRDELTAAQQVNDPDRVLEIHAGLAAVLPAEALAEVEGQVVKWFLALIMRRLRGGTVRPDVAELATRVAERFPRSVEGASLRASLATLRRSAGLCPRCCRPYKGIADACPLCLASAAPPAPETARPDTTWTAEPRPEDEAPNGSSSRGLDYPVFLDDPT